MNTQRQTASEAIQKAAEQAANGLVNREVIIELMMLCAVAGEHLLIIGPPGTAKSAAVRRMASALGGRYFEYLLGRFTEPAELFGPVDFRKLSEGIVETATDGMLPEAEVAFLDEVFLGSTAILNTLLGVLNEKQFKRGHTRIDCPLRLCVAASNQLPEDEALAAFADRFLVHCFVEPVEDALLEQLLTQGWKMSSQAMPHCCDLTQLDQLAEVARTADMSQVIPALASCIRTLRKEGIHLSDRRIVKAQRLIAAAACIDGREQPGEADLWPLLYVIPTEEGQDTARKVLKDALQRTDNEALNAAAEQASMGPLVRANRLQKAASLLLEQSEAGREELEALGREIDASFPLEAMPQNLRDAREQLMTRLSELSL